MSRGGWIMIIGGVVLLVGIGLFAFGFASLVPTPELTPLSPGDYRNWTMDLQGPGSILTYLVQIENFTAGDEVTVFVQIPSGEDVQRTTLNTASLTIESYLATEAGNHTVVIQNTASQSVDISSAASEITVTVATLVTIGTFLGFAGFIVLIVGLVLWLVDRRRRPRPTMEMPPPPS